MARKSRWQQFADNFNSVYGTFTNVAKNYEAGNIMNEEYADDAGIALTGADLDRRRMSELAKVYTKYGDAEGGLSLRNQLATLEAADRENQLNQDIYSELVKQRGILQSNLMGSQIYSNNASGNASNANAGYTNFRTERGRAMLPGELTFQGLQNEGAAIGNAQATEDLNYSILSNPERFRGLQIGNDQAAYNLGVDYETRDDEIATRGANATTAVNAATQSTETLDSTIEASNNANALSSAESLLGINTAEQALQTATTEDEILSAVMAAGHENVEDANADTIARIQASDIPLERQRELISTVQQMGLERLVNEGAQFTQAGLNALNQGLEAGVKWYDTVDNNDTLTIDRESVPGTTIIRSTVGDTSRELFRGSGENADAQILAQMATQIQKPSAALTIAAQVADVENTRARTSLIGKQEFSELLNQDYTVARTALVEAQADQIREEIKTTGGGLGKAQEIALRGLADLMKSDEYVYMGTQDKGEELQAAALEQYRREMGLPPGGVSAAEWDAMDDEEKAAFR